MSEELKKEWERDLKERNMVHLSLLTPKHKLLAIENTKYQPVLLESFINSPCPVPKG